MSEGMVAPLPCHQGRRKLQVVGEKKHAKIDD